jgi:hypothetical protein
VAGKIGKIMAYDGLIPYNRRFVSRGVRCRQSAGARPFAPAPDNNKTPRFR